MFFSCPRSLVEFKMAYLISGTTSAYNLEPVETDWDFDQGTLQLREDPLFQLKKFALSAISQDLTPVFRAVLEYRPAPEAIDSPYLGELTDDMMFILASLGEVCPSLSSLSFPEGCRPEHIYTILEALPSHRLKEFSSRGFRDPDPAPMMTAVARHSTTLQKIELINCIQIKSKAIQSALTLCVALEVLSVTGPGDHSKGSWTEEQHRIWEDLGRLYTQIGSLTQLEILDLRAVGRKVHVIDYDTDRVIFLPPSETCLPGLLALEDSRGTGQQIGYLSRLAGLTRLRELKGVELSPEPPQYDRDSHIHHHLWLIRLNFATLTYLDFALFDIQSLQVVRDVARTTSQLNNLRTFRLGICTNQLITRSVLEILFFSCPSSLVDLDFSKLGVSITTTPSIDPKMGDWDFDQGPLILRAEPFPNLKRLALPLVPSKGGFSGSIKNIIEDIDQLCPFLSRVSFPSNCLGVHMMRIMEVIPAGHLKAISSCYRSLANLQVLSLAAMGWRSIGADRLNQGFALTPLEICLPGLLALDDVATGQIGYLEKFAK
ncbi:hypothetical protein BGX24_011882 [Mortierella sp. AD032]|nr:hypothetical protein BGX24_011882 [Mortierella sp. AD032]